MASEMYHILKIDLMGSYPFADVFDSEKYWQVAEGEDLDTLVKLAVEAFKALNSEIKTWSDWFSNTENDGWEIEILNQNPSLIFRASILLVDPIVEYAFWLAHKYHSGQKRKAGGGAYLAHILVVGDLLRKENRVNPDPELIAAGFCHDLLEDTSCTENEIKEKCGEEVLRIVKAISNDKQLDENDCWEEKKLKYISTTEAGGKKAMLVCLADKIANARALIELKKEMGDKVWTKFNRGKDKKIWFEEVVLGMLKKHLIGHSFLRVYEELIAQMRT